MSHTVVRDKVIPRLDDSDKPLFLIVIDNLRYDQWKAIQPLIETYFRVEADDIYYSILPTTSAAATANGGSMRTRKAPKTNSRANCLASN